MASKIFTVDDFSIGKDLRKGASVSDANRLRELENGFVTNGKALEKRWGTTKVAYLETGTVGLVPASGVLNTFTNDGTITHANKTLPVRYRAATSTAGLDDATSGGTYSGTKSTIFTIKIDAVGTPDTFSWRKDDGVLTSGVSITGGAQTLSDSVTITFAATTGHTLGDVWTIRTLVITPNQTVGNNVPAGAFTGSGLDDLTTGGSYTGSGTPVFTLEVEAPETAGMTAQADAGGGITTISTGTTPANGSTVVHTGTTSYNGTFVTQNTVLNTSYDIVKTFVSNEATGTWEKSPNTFKWKKDSGGYTTGIAMTTALTSFSEDVKVQWAALVGHTTGDVWTITISAVVTVVKVHFADVFNGFIYTSLEYSNGTITHHYLDGTSPTRITDENCPNTRGVLKMQQKIFAIDGDLVDFSKTGDPRDWTTASDAGFLSVGLHQAGNDDAKALGQYQQTQMVVFFVDGSQIWTVDPDPANHLYSQALPGAQCRYHRSVASLFQDLFFLSDSGPRSIAENALTSSSSEIDIGSPLDEDFRDILPIVPSDTPLGLFFRTAGQYWLINGSTVFVFTLSKTARISAWGVYEFPWEISDVAELDGQLYLRSGRNLFLYDRDVNTDAGDTVGSATADSDNTGLDDATSGGTFTSAPDVVFTVEIDAEGTPDTFKWKKNSGAYTTGVSITGAAQTLSDGVTITFTATTGHTLGDVWTIDTGHIAFEMTAELSFLDARLPSILKQWGGMDFVGLGTARISIKWDPNNASNITAERSFTGDSQGNDFSPIEISSVSLSLVIKNKLDERFRVDRISILYDALGPV